MTRWTVVQPAATPEIIHLAKAIAQAGRLETYISSTAFAEDSVWGSELARRVFDQIDRRLLPAPITKKMTINAGTIAEFLFKSIHGRSLFQDEQIRLMRLRASQVHARARREIRRRPIDQPRGVIVQAGQSHHTLEMAKHRGYRLVVNTSIVHRRFIAQEIESEIARYPTWSSGLHEYIRPEHELEGLDQELSLADTILVQSKFQADVLRRFGVSSEKICMVPLGVDDSFHENDLRRRSPVSPKGPLRLGWLGQVTQRKGFADLLEALGPELVRDGYELIVAGLIEGNVESLVQRPGVKLLGAIPHKDVRGWLDSIDVLVSPSILEGFSLAPVEAMAAGVPVVVSERLFVSDHITTGVDGWVVNARDTSGLRAALEEVRSLSAPELEAIGQAGSLLVQGLRWQGYERRIRQIFCGETVP